MSFHLSSARRSTNRIQHQIPCRFRRRRRLWVPESLEERVLLLGNPTYYTVNLTTDTGASSGTDATTGNPSGDLLWAITQANANSNTAGSVIDFDPTVFNASNPLTIAMSNTLELFETAGPEEIEGPGAGLLSIDGGGAVSVFQVDSDVTATLSGLTITDGAAGGGSGINNSGMLTVSSCSVTANEADLQSGSGNGGGIWNSGTLNVEDSTLANNYAGEDGGGIWSSGTLTIVNSTVAANQCSGEASGNGGGICLSSGSLTAVNATIAYNINYGAAGGGAGLYDQQGSTATLDNTIIAQNTDGDGSGEGPSPPDDIAGAVSSASAYNLIGSVAAGGLTSGTNGNLVGISGPALGLAAWPTTAARPRPSTSFPAAWRSAPAAPPWPSIPRQDCS